MSSRLGNAKENIVRDDLARLGWIAMCGRCSRGPADVLAVKRGEQPRMIQVKGTSLARGPYADFPPADRDMLVQEAAKAGAVALLAWLPRGARDPMKIRYIPSDQWPVSTRKRAA